VRSVAASTRTFDRFLRKMDDFMGYGMRATDEYENIWDMDLPPFGWE